MTLGKGKTEICMWIKRSAQTREVEEIKMCNSDAKS